MRVLAFIGGYFGGRALASGRFWRLMGWLLLALMTFTAFKTNGTSIVMMLLIDAFFIAMAVRKSRRRAEADLAYSYGE